LASKSIRSSGIGSYRHPRRQQSFVPFPFRSVLL
jgi:hypothetical protein